MRLYGENMEFIVFFCIMYVFFGTLDALPGVFTGVLMIIAAAASAELDDVADPETAGVRLAAERADAVVPRDEIIEKLHAGPGGCAIGGRAVIPAEGGCVIHGAGSGVHALRDEVGTIAADPVIALEKGIALKRPPFCVLERTFSIVFYGNKHGKLRKKTSLHDMRGWR